MSDLFDKALALATKAHEGQKRWDGSPYINHPVAVAASVVFDKEKVVAVLHDVYEDHPEYLTELKKFPSWVMGAVSLLSKQNDDDYHAFIMRIAKSNNRVAIRVKIADITHNLSDLSRGAMRDKYMLARQILLDSLIN